MCVNLKNHKRTISTVEDNLHTVYMKVKKKFIRCYKVIKKPQNGLNSIQWTRARFMLVVDFNNRHFE